MNGTTRRTFLSTAAASSVLTFGRRAPAFLHSAAAAATSEERILVVVEMAGGNDGLNTVIPFRNDKYRQGYALPLPQTLKKQAAGDLRHPRDPQGCQPLVPKPRHDEKPREQQKEAGERDQVEQVRQKRRDH